MDIHKFLHHAFNILSIIYLIVASFKYATQTLSIVGVFFMGIVALLLYGLSLMYHIIILLEKILNNQKTKGGKK